MKAPNHSGGDTHPRDVPVPDRNRDIEQRTERLRQAVESNGGRQAVARRARVPLGTLNKYLAGRDMPAANLVLLCGACQVRVDWLALGFVEPSEPETPKAGKPEPTLRPRLFTTVNVDKLAEALESVLAKVGHDRTALDWRHTLQAAILIYDLMQEPERDTNAHGTGQKS